MRKVIIGLIILIMSFPILSVDMDIEIGFVTTYVWRGFTLYDKNVFAIQPSLTYYFGKSGLSLNLWSSYALKDRDLYKQNEEIDMTLRYDFRPFNGVEVGVGFTNYGYYYINNYSFKDGNTQEFFLITTFPYLIFCPTVSMYYDINLGNGLYFSLSGNYSVELNRSLSLDIGMSIGYNSGQWVDSHGLSDANLTIGLPLNYNNFSITPYVAYTHVFLEPVSPDNLDKFWAGFSISLN